MLKHLVHILLFSVLLYSVSCTRDEECRKNRNVNLEVGLYRVTYNEATNTFIKSSLAVDSITLRGIKFDSLGGQEIYMDSILYNNTKRINKLILPLNNSSNQSKFYINFNQVADTITVYHTNYDYYLSLECGCIKTFTIDTVLTTNNFIDSVKITFHNVNNNNAEHLQIYN
jgi:hypothetical protein